MAPHRGRESGCNVLIPHEPFSVQSGEICNSIKGVRQILIPPFPGSNPGAPASGLARKANVLRLIFLFYFVAILKRIFIPILKFRSHCVRESVCVSFSRCC
jgi:hypothetical protein